MKKVLFHWSGGKDSSLCLYKLLQSKEHEVCQLLTTVSEARKRVSMHGTREALIHLQSQHIGIPLHPVQLPDRLDMEEYGRIMFESLNTFRDDGIRYGAFGDIFLEDLRSYRETKLAEVDMKAIFPLWDQPTERLAREFIDLGFKAVLSSVDGRTLDASFVGREYNHQLLTDLPEDVDPCGENGEFHTFVYDGPIFEAPVPVKKGKIVERSYEPNKDSAHSFSDRPDRSTSFSYWFIDLFSENSD